MSKAATSSAPHLSTTAGLRAVLLVWFCVLTCPGIGWSHEPPRALTSEAIARYVADLNNDSRAVRVAAEAALMAAGPAVLEALPIAGSLPDPAARESLDRIIHAIETQEFQSALKPRTVRLADVHNLRDASVRIAKETENRLAVPDQPFADSALIFAAAPLTFWEAIDSIEKQSKLRYHSEKFEPAMAGCPDRLSSVSGPFRVELIHCNQRTTSLGQRLMNIKIRLACEPRLRPLFLMAAVDDWSINCEKSKATAFTPMARREIPSTSEREIDVAFDFVVPPSVDDQAIWTISGQLDLTLAAQSTSVTFSDLTGKLPLTRRRGQASLSLLQVRSTVVTSSIRLATAFPHMAGLFESYRASLLAPELTLEMPGADRLTPIDTTQLQEAPQGLILEYQFGKALSPGTRLTATIPSAISTQKVPFRFDKVTLTTQEN